MSKGDVIVLRGIPGSGKTTFAKQFFPTDYRISADNYLGDPSGTYRYSTTSVQEAHRQCWQCFLSRMLHEDTILVDNTNITLDEISPYVLPAESFGYKVTILTLMVLPSVAGPRNQHAVPQQVIDKMAEKLDAHTRLIPNRWRHCILNL